MPMVPSCDAMDFVFVSGLLTQGDPRSVDIQKINVLLKETLYEVVLVWVGSHQPSLPYSAEIRNPSPNLIVITC